MGQKNIAQEKIKWPGLKCWAKANYLGYYGGKFDPNKIDQFLKVGLSCKISFQSPRIASLGQ